MLEPSVLSRLAQVPHSRPDVVDVAEPDGAVKRQRAVVARIHTDTAGRAAPGLRGGDEMLNEKPSNPPTPTGGIDHDAGELALDLVIVVPASTRSRPPAPSATSRIR